MNLTCVKATAFENNGSTQTLLKLQGAGSVVEDSFGKSTSQVTYYRFVEGDKSDMLKKTGNVNLDQFDIVTREREFADEETGEMITRTLKYLYAKRAE